MSRSSQGIRRVRSPGISLSDRCLAVALFVAVLCVGVVALVAPALPAQIVVVVVLLAAPALPAQMSC